MRPFVCLCLLAACSRTSTGVPDALQQIFEDAPAGQPDAPAADAPPDALVHLDGGKLLTSQIWVAGDLLVDLSNLVGGFADTATLPFGPATPTPLAIPGGTAKLAGPPLAGYTSATFDATASKIAFVADLATAGTFDLYVANADGSSPVRLVAGQAGVEIASVYLSPDGTKVAYTADSVALNGGYDLYVVATTLGSAPVKVSPDRPGTSPAPANQDVFSIATWSADSRYVGFSGDLTTDTFDQAYVADTSTSPPTTATLLAVTDIGTQPAGAQGVRGTLQFDAADNVYFRARTIATSTNFQLFQAKPDGSLKTNISSAAPLRGDASTPDLGAFGTSPDGTQLVFAADSTVVGGYDLYVAPTATLVAAKLTALTAVGHPDFLSPLWFSPDGTRVAYVANFATARNEPFVSRLDGSDTHRLISVTATCPACASPDANLIQWTADGRAVYISGDLLTNNDTKLFRADPAMTDQTPTLAVDLPANGDVFNVIVRPGM